MHCAYVEPTQKRQMKCWHTCCTVAHSLHIQLFPHEEFDMEYMLHLHVTQTTRVVVVVLVVVVAVAGIITHTHRVYIGSDVVNVWETYEAQQQRIMRTNCLAIITAFVAFVLLKHFKGTSTTNNKLIMRPKQCRHMWRMHHEWSMCAIIQQKCTTTECNHLTYDYFLIAREKSFFAHWENTPLQRSRSCCISAIIYNNNNNNNACFMNTTLRMTCFAVCIGCNVEYALHNLMLNANKSHLAGKQKNSLRNPEDSNCDNTKVLRIAAQMVRERVSKVWRQLFSQMWAQSNHIWACDILHLRHFIQSLKDEYVTRPICTSSSDGSLPLF